MFFFEGGGKWHGSVEGEDHGDTGVTFEKNFFWFGNMEENVWVWKSRKQEWKS